MTLADDGGGGVSVDLTRRLTPGARLPGHSVEVDDEATRLHEWQRAHRELGGGNV